ncbi:hypothetical protein Taro_010594 [Colocasia esculenta]|uniref:Uncharacterized protein n=1 Tax=Colocasia esculenta TaxID=4460 RepID=A0A843U3H3_COLES|nr:hypothetical protein [Colocasia esculenta]
MVGLPCFRSLQLCCACRPERLASISLDARISIGVQVWTLTPPQRPGVDAKGPSARTLSYAENHAYHAYIHAICIRPHDLVPLLPFHHWRNKLRRRPEEGAATTEAGDLGGVGGGSIISDLIPPRDARCAMVVPASDLWPPSSLPLESPPTLPPAAPHPRGNKCERKNLYRRIRRCP